jgi:hypothetical protein
MLLEPSAVTRLKEGPMSFNSEQEEFWAKAYAKDYIKKNSSFDHALGAMGGKR